MGKKKNHKANAEQKPGGWCPECGYPTVKRDGDSLACQWGHEYSKDKEVHVAPSSGGSDMDDLDYAVLQMDRMEAARKPKPIDRLKEALGKLSAVFGNEPPPQGESNELTKEERDCLREILQPERQRSRYQLPKGRQVQLTRFALASTYIGVMEGSPETASKYILGQISEHASRLLPPAKPLVVVPTFKIPLPKWMCVAKLSSEGTQQYDPDYRSFLYACWFTYDTNRSIDSMIEEILPYLDWEQNAQDYNIMDF